MILLEDRVLLKLDKTVKDKKVGGIIIASKEEDNYRDFVEADVIGVGESSITEHGVVIKTQVRVGDRVLVPASISGKWYHEDEEYHITNERSIVAILNR